MVIVQALAQIAAVTVPRRRQPALRRPYRMWLYPLPSLVALLGWLVIYGTADLNSPGRHPIEWSLAWIGAGMAAFLLWARREKERQFGPKRISEEYLAGEPRSSRRGTGCGRGRHRTRPPKPPADRIPASRERDDDETASRGFSPEKLPAGSLRLGIRAARLLTRTLGPCAARKYDSCCELC